MASDTTKGKDAQDPKSSGKSSSLGTIIAVVVIALLVMGVSAAFILPSMTQEAAEAPETSSPSSAIAEPGSEAAPTPAVGIEVAAAIPGDTPDEVPWSAPVIQVETERYDMGVIGRDGITTQYMKIFNRGSAPLVISQIRTSCGCTKGRMLETTIPAGGESQLEITVDPALIPGFSSTKVLTIYSNDPNNTTVRINVDARVDPELDMYPEVLDFGTVRRGEGAEQVVTIRQLQDEPFELTGVELVSKSAGYHVELHEVPEKDWAAPGHREYKIITKVSPDAAPGIGPRRLRISTNIPRIPQITIPVNVEVKGLYDVKPLNVVLRAVNAGETLQAVLKITAESPLEITSFAAENANLTVNHRPGDDPNTVVFDIEIAQNPATRLLRDVWTFGVKTQDEEFTESVRVLAILDARSLATAAKETPATEAKSEGSE